MWKGDEPIYADSFSEVDPEEADYARVLQVINHFLPVKEMAGRLIEVPMLRQFGLVESEALDNFLHTAFCNLEESDPSSQSQSKETPTQTKVKVAAPRSLEE